MGSKHTEVPSSGVAALIVFAAQAQLAQFLIIEASAQHTLSFRLKLGDATGMQEGGVCAADVCLNHRQFVNQ